MTSECDRRRASETSSDGVLLRVSRHGTTPKLLDTRTRSSAVTVSKWRRSPPTVTTAAAAAASAGSGRLMESTGINEQFFDAPVSQVTYWLCLHRLIVVSQ